MKRIFFFICAGAVTLLVSPLAASTLDEKAAALTKAIKDEIAARPPPSTNAPPSAAYFDRFAAGQSYLAANLSQLVAQVNENPAAAPQVEAQIQQILATFSSEAVQNAGRDLLDELHKESKAHEDAAQKQVTDLMAHISDTVAQAKKPEDLDSLLGDLQKFQGAATYNYNPETQRLYQQVPVATEFVKQWQNYLAHLASGQKQLAQNDLQNLSQNNYACSIMPRSRLLALMAPMNGGSDEGAASGSAVDILNGIKTLDDIGPALQQVQALRAYDPQSSMVAQGLTSLFHAYNSAKTGSPENIQFFINDSAETLPAMSALRTRVLLYLLQQRFDTFRGNPPAPGETPSAFVTRVVADAIDRQDWALVQKVQGTLGSLNLSGEMGTSGSSLAWSDSMVVAANQEAAGQYTQAVLSYEAALRVPSDTVPAKVIGDKLAAIKKDHPQDYERGTQLGESVQPVYRMVYPYPSGTAPYGAPRFIPGMTTNPFSAQPGTSGNSSGIMTRVAPVAPIPTVSTPPATNAPVATPPQASPPPASKPTAE